MAAALATSPALCMTPVAAEPPARLPVVDVSPDITASPAGRQAEVEGLFQSFKKRRQLERKVEAERSPVVDVRPQRWLRSSSAIAAREVSRRLLGQASGEYGSKAWASAEASAWEALQWAAESVELADRESGTGGDFHPLQDLTVARVAIREARDFGGLYGPVDEQAVGRMVRSHRTAVLKGNSWEKLTAADAIDRYLDEARVRLSPIAARSVEAARAMDLIAAVILGRADPTAQPSSTALALRRAALQGQPDNASLASRLGMHLADVGLDDEAQWALGHSLRREPTRETAEALMKVLRRHGKSEDAERLAREIESSPLLAAQNVGARVPRVDHVSPQEFASISKPVIKDARPSRDGTRDPSTERGPSTTRLVGGQRDVASGEVFDSKVRTASLVKEHDSVAQKTDPADKPGLLKRAWGSIRRLW